MGSLESSRTYLCVLRKWSERHLRRGVSTRPIWLEQRVTCTVWLMQGIAKWSQFNELYAKLARLRMYAVALLLDLSRAHTLDSGIYTHTLCVWICTCIYVWIYIYVHMYAYTNMYMFIYIYTKPYISIHVCINVYIRIYVYIYIY